MTTTHFPRQKFILAQQEVFRLPPNLNNIDFASKHLISYREEFSSRMRKEGPQTLKDLRLAIAYPTTKELKIAPLRAELENHLAKLSINLKSQIDEFKFKVEITGVGEQPLHPDGLVGAVNRVNYIQEALLGLSAWTQSFKMPDLCNYDRVIIPSMESDIYDAEGLTFDKPNIMFYECITGTNFLAMGPGPGVQREILAVAKRLGHRLFGDTKAVTYGNALSAMFSDDDGIQIDPADWHVVVTGKHRDYYVSLPFKESDVKTKLDEFTKKIIEKYQA